SRLRPAEETPCSSLLREIAVQRVTFGSHHQPFPDGPEALPKLLGLRVQMLFRPPHKLRYIPFRQQGQVEEHLPPGVCGVLQYDQSGVPSVCLHLMPLAYPPEALTRHLAELLAQPIPQTQTRKQRCQVLCGQNLLLLDDHSVDRRVPGSQS